MAQFVRHGPCEKCGSKDNRAHYSDGSSYCFGCKAYTRPTNVVYNEEEPRSAMNILAHIVEEIPEPNLTWLRQYLTDEQIRQFFFYCPKLKRHVYLEFEGRDLAYWEARSVIPSQKKVLSSGRKPYKVWGKWKETSVVVFVEDIVSAIKVSEVAGVCCLHGSVIPNSVFENVGKMPGVSMVIIWLDRDKLSEASTYARKFEFWGMECAFIMSPRDPKDYDKNEIAEMIQNAI